MAIENKTEQVSKINATPGSWIATFAARLRADDAGQSMIELALLTPVFLLLITGMLTFGLACNNYIQLTEATSVGARALAISRSETTDPCATVASAVYAAAPSLTPGSLSFSFFLNGTPYSGPTCPSTSNTTGAAGNLVQGTNATVIVSYPCTLKVYGANYAPNCALQSQMTEYIQ